MRRGVVPEGDTADREAPAANQMKNACHASGRCCRRRGTSAARTSARACPPCPPRPRRCAARRRARARSWPPRSSTSRISMIHDHDVDRDREILDEQRDRGGDEQHAVGGGVEDLAQLAALVEVPGDVAVDPVGGAEHRRAAAAAAIGSSFAQSSQRNTGTHASRTSEIRFGIVQTRPRLCSTARAQGTRLEPGGRRLRPADRTRRGTRACRHSIACAMARAVAIARVTTSISWPRAAQFVDPRPRSKRSSTVTPAVRDRS